MSTITLKYNSRNRIARETINYIRSLGVFKTKEFESPFVESDRDIREGRVYSAKNADDLIAQCLE